MPHDVAHDAEATRALFRAILAQATADALDQAHGGERPTEGEVWAARRWFRGDPPGVEVVCRLAGVSPELVRRTMARRITELAYPTLAEEET